MRITNNKQIIRKNSAVKRLQPQDIGRLVLDLSCLSRLLNLLRLAISWHISRFVQFVLLLFLIGCTQDENKKEAKIEKGIVENTELQSVPLFNHVKIANPVTSPFSHRNDLWHELRREFELSTDHPEVDKWVKYYKKDPYYFVLINARVQSYLPYIIELVKKRGLPGELALVPIVESGLRPNAKSSAGAVGLWQLMPLTARHYNMNLNEWVDSRHDVVHSTEVALTYFEELEDKFGNWYTSLAAYNAGETLVRRKIRKAKANGQSSDFWDLKLPKETRLYVPKILALAKIIKSEDFLGLPLENLPYKPSVELVIVPHSTKLKKIAVVVGLEIDTVRKFNSMFKKRKTPPNGLSYLYLPSESASILRNKLKEDTD